MDECKPWCQAARRGSRGRREFLARKSAAVTVQRHVRGWIARESYLDVKCVAVVCQVGRQK